MVYGGGQETGVQHRRERKLNLGAWDNSAQHSDSVECEFPHLEYQIVNKVRTTCRTPQSAVPRNERSISWA
jgi:hypothetical protein